MIASCIASLDLIFGDDSDNNDDRSKSKGLPPVLVHRDLGTANIMVDPATCHLTGVVDWAESRIAPFGTNLHSLQAICGHMHLRHGWSRYDDYHALQGAFWSGLQGGIVAAGEERLDDATIEAIKMARKIGLLLSHGFTSRLANQPDPVPIDENTDHGRYHMHYLDGFLINEATRFD